MSSKKDLVEAHSFNRRRLITAFVSGAPGGREVEPVRYGRTLVGGLVLAVLVVAGAAVTPLLTQKDLPKDWNVKGLVVGKDTGSRFVAVNKTLYPVINTTSARLLLGTDGKFEVSFVPEGDIAKQKQGQTIGIPGAPDLLPTPSNLIQSGWTACTASTGGVRVTLSTAKQVTPRPADAFVVTTQDGGTVVVAGQAQYAVPRGAQGNAILRALGLDGDAPAAVPGLWLDLVQPGRAIEPFTVDGEGDRVNTGIRGLETVGTPVRVDDRPYVLGKKGLLPLTDFAYTVYRSAGPGATLQEQQVQSGQLGRLDTVSDPGARPYPSNWPEQNVTPFDRGDSPCLQLTTSPDAAATVGLAAPTEGSTAPSVTTGISRGVDSGHGALVQASAGGVIGSGTTFLIDSTGTRYAVGSKADAGSALTALGYGGEKPQPVPAAWLELFQDGPALSSQAAARPTGGQS
ncbi:MAG: type VII secretion protein EccB [Nocardioidaceae bacterium]